MTYRWDFAPILDNWQALAFGAIGKLAAAWCHRELAE